jgi:LysM repeat protein
MGKRPGTRWHRHAAPTRAQALAGLALPVVAAAGLVTPHTYTVRPGDTLSGIAQQVYGNAADWTALFAANRGTVTDPDLIYAGEVLQVPAYQPRHAKPDPAPVQAPATALSGTLGCPGLEALWESAGGAPGEAFTAAEIAMAESGGNQYALSPWGDRGYWQIAGSWGPLSTFSASGNAHAAVIISRDGTDWYPWSTFTSGAYAGRC